MTTYLVKEASGFLQNTLILLQLALPPTQLFPTPVHFVQPPLVFLELLLQFIVRVLSTRAYGGKRWDGCKWRNSKRRGERCELRAEETKTSSHLGETT